MAFNDIELARYKKSVSAYIENKRPPVHIRKEVDISFRITGQSVEIFEVRPRWDDPAEILEHFVAKATYIKTQEHWKVFWQRADLKWHSYDPNPTVANIDKFLVLIEVDEHACFWG